MFFVLAQNPDGVVLIQTLSSLLPLTTLVNLNPDLSLGKPLTDVLNPTASCDVAFLDFLCYALARDVPKYLSSHAALYSHQTLSSIIEWNRNHPEYIPYGQTLFERAVDSPITDEQYQSYKTILQKAFQMLVDHLKTFYRIDCLLTIGNDDLLTGTTICGIPRANLTLDYYEPEHQKLNVVAVGLEPGDDLIILTFLRRLEKANLQAGKIDIRTPFQKYIRHPVENAYRRRCSIL